MAYREEIIQKIKNQFPYLSARFGVKRIGLFGSVAERMETGESDIDLIVEFDRPIGLKFISMVEYLEGIFGRKVDVLTREGLRSIRIEAVSSDIKKNIIYV